MLHNFFIIFFDSRVKFQIRITWIFKFHISLHLGKFFIPYWGTNLILGVLNNFFITFFDPSVKFHIRITRVFKFHVSFHFGKIFLWCVYSGSTILNKHVKRRLVHPENAPLLMHHTVYTISKVILSSTTFIRSIFSKNSTTTIYSAINTPKYGKSLKVTYPSNFV